MGRRINTVSLQANDGKGSGEEPDDYATRIVKLIPSDVVAAWLSVTTAIRSASEPPGRTLLWVIFAVGLVVAALWTYRQTKKPGKPKPWVQVGVSSVAFCVWAYATGGVAPQFPGAIYKPLYATLLLVGFSLASGLVTDAAPKGAAVSEKPTAVR